MEKKPVSHIMLGLIISLVLIIDNLVIYFAGQMQNKLFGLFGAIILIVGIAYSCILYAKQMNGNVTFGQDFAFGFKTTAVVIVIMVVWTVISMKIIFPDMIDKSIEASRAELEKQGKLSDEQIDSIIEPFKKGAILIGIAGVIIGYAFMGAIASLIGAAIAKKNPQQQNPFG